MCNECFYCKKTFSRNSDLKRHQITAKYCLALRPEPVLNLKTYNCNYCEYTNNSKYDLAKHVKTCKYKIISEQKEEDNIRVKNLLLEQENALLKKQRDEYKIEANKPKEITNNNNLTFNMKQQFFQQTLQPITDVLETISDEINKRYTPGHFLKGQEGCAQIVSEILNNENNKYYLTDSNSGDVFMYKDDDNTVRTDDKARLIIEASKDPLEKAANGEYQNKIEEARDLYDDNSINMTKCIKIYKSKLQEVRELPTNSIKFRKKLSENMFISNQTMKTNKECPQDINKGYALLERIKPKDINVYFTDKRIYEELDKLTNDEIELFSDIKGLINFLVEKFLLVNDRLIYKYDQENDRFVYYEESGNMIVKKYETDPIRFKVIFFFTVKKFLSKKRKPDISSYISTLSDEIIRQTLVDLLIKVEVI